MARWIYPGSFDPPTLGHLDIITRAAALTDELLVAVLVNPGRNPAFTVSERVDMLRQAAAGMGNVRVDSFDGLLADYVRRAGARAVVRGVRTMADYDIEMQMAHLNRQLNDEMETLFIPADPRWSSVSSTWVRQIGAMGGELFGLVPASILPRVKERLTVKK